MTPTETLRAAATKLRELANAATPGHWDYNDLSLEADGLSILDGCCEGDGWIGKTGDGELIAALGPITAQLLANWLSSEATDCEAWEAAAEERVGTAYAPDAFALAAHILGEKP